MNRGIIVFKDKQLSLEELLSTEKSVLPESDVYETGVDYFLTVNMPGVSRDNITVKILDSQLIIFGRINYDDVMNRDYILNETERGNYYRSFKIADSVDQPNIEAKYENGQLILKLPKKENIKSRTITIL
jgi:HSP20 family protein